MRFLGALDREGVRELLRAADVLALASQYEGLPTVILEAWACGRAAVAPPVGDVPALLADGGGRVAADGRPKTLAQALQAAFDDVPTQPASRAAQEARLRERSAPYDWEHVTNRILEVYAAAQRHRGSRTA